MPKKEKYGDPFVKHIENLRAATGYVPPAKKVNIPLQTLKYMPGEMAKTTKEALFHPIRYGETLGKLTIEALKKRIKKKK
jgi:hypothetical protein